MTVILGWVIVFFLGLMFVLIPPVFDPVKVAYRESLKSWVKYLILTGGAIIILTGLIGLAVMLITGVL